MLAYAQIQQAHGGQDQFLFISVYKGVQFIVVEDPQILKLLVPALAPGLVSFFSINDGYPDIPKIGLPEPQDHTLMQFKYRAKKNDLVVGLRNQTVNLV
jgi:hypothetical protein